MKYNSLTNFNFCRAQYGLFVLKVSLNSNQPTSNVHRITVLTSYIGYLSKYDNQSINQSIRNLKWPK